MAAQAAKRINKVGFLVAMQEEAAPFIGALKLQKRAPHARARDRRPRGLLQGRDGPGLFTRRRRRQVPRGHGRRVPDGVPRGRR